MLRKTRIIQTEKPDAIVTQSSGFSVIKEESPAAGMRRIKAEIIDKAK